MKDYSFLVHLKEVTTHRVYVKAKTRKEAIERVKEYDVDEWGKDYGSEDSQLVGIAEDTLEQKIIWEDES